MRANAPTVLSRSAAVVGLSLVTALLATAASGCDERNATAEPPAYLFDPRTPLGPELEKLKAAGDDPTKVHRPGSAAELTKLLEPGKRYAYVVLPNGTLAIAPKSADAPGNFWTHAILANGGAVKSAGHLRIERTGDNLAKVIVDAESETYCPTNESLRSTLAALSALKVPNDLLRVDNRPSDCHRPKEKEPKAAAAAGPRPSFGTVMLSVARRFETLGRAHKAKRDELAGYALEELEETFVNEVPATPPPPLPPGVTLKPFVDAMTKTAIPELKKALEAKDPKAVEAAFATMAKTCNACHTSTGRAFIEVPETPGAAVPKIEAKP